MKVLSLKLDITPFVALMLAAVLFCISESGYSADAGDLTTVSDVAASATDLR